IRTDRGLGPQARQKVSPIHCILNSIMARKHIERFDANAPESIVLCDLVTEALVLEPSLRTVAALLDHFTSNAFPARRVVYILARLPLPTNEVSTALLL